MKHLTSEFSGCELGDKRLDKRLISIINSLIGSPEKSFPEAFANSAELEGFYRFVENPYVKLENILACHIKTTIHVCDSETDSYALLAELSEKKHRFVIRECYDRALINGEHLRETFINKKTLFSKEIFLSTRERKSGGQHNKRLVKRDARKA